MDLREGVLGDGHSVKEVTLDILPPLPSPCNIGQGARCPGVGHLVADRVPLLGSAIEGQGGEGLSH